MSKSELKIKAQNLRRDGMTYSEILKVIPVAKSTISLWLREVGMSKKQKQNITQKRIDAQRKGADAQRNKRIKRQSFLIDRAKNEIGKISKRELWLIGTALYWAEGSKQKNKSSISTRVQFSNSDSDMIKVFLQYVKVCLEIPDERISCDIYVHENHRNTTDKLVIFWSRVTGYPREHFTRIYFKKHKIKTNRHNIGNLYNGLLRVNIRESSDQNRIIRGWTEGIIGNCGIV